MNLIQWMMAYNKKQHLKDNIEAIRTAYELKDVTATVEQLNIMQKYSGFGGLKCILRSIDSEDSWKSNKELFPLVTELHDMIKKHSNDYQKTIDSIKNSVLTSFYTPPQIVDTIAEVLAIHEVTANRLLDPSAGLGVFSSAFRKYSPNAEITNFEKEESTAMILSQINFADEVRNEPFQKIEPHFKDYYDIVTSNIPFGDVQIWDAEYSKSKDNAKQKSLKTVHNYFFLKGMDTLRDGGILAFVTSQGVLNSPINKPIRE